MKDDELIKSVRNARIDLLRSTIKGQNILIESYKKDVEKLEADKKALSKKVGELQDLIIWMTGCGYDYCQHDYFCKKRDELLKHEVDK